MTRLFALACAGLLAGCQSAGLPPLATVPHVEMNSFMGDWYVIAHITPYPDRNAWTAIGS